MFDSKEKAAEWICQVIDKHAWTPQKAFPNRTFNNSNGDHFFKISFDLDTFLISADNMRGDEKWGRKWKYVIPFKSL